MRSPAAAKIAGAVGGHARFSDPARQMIAADEMDVGFLRDIDPRDQRQGILAILELLDSDHSDHGRGTFPLRAPPDAVHWACGSPHCLSG
jgi:hypothetical protein